MAISTRDISTSSRPDRPPERRGGSDRIAGLELTDGQLLSKPPMIELPVLLSELSF